MERVSEACVRALASSCPAGSLSGTDFLNGRAGGSAAAAMNFALIGSRGAYWTLPDWALYYSILGARGVHPGAPKARPISPNIIADAGVVKSGADLKAHTPFNACHLQRLCKEGAIDAKSGQMVPWVRQGGLDPVHLDGKTPEQVAVGYGALLLNVWQTLDAPAKPTGGTSTGKKATARRARKATASKATAKK